MNRTVQGKIHGTTIQLDEDPGLPDGQQVSVALSVADESRAWGEGIKRSAGAGANIPEFDEVVQQVERDRKSATFREPAE